MTDLCSLLDGFTGPDRERRGGCWHVLLDGWAGYPAGSTDTPGLDSDFTGPRASRVGNDVADADVFLSLGDLPTPAGRVLD